MGQRRGCCFHQFSELWVLKDQYALGNETESALQTVADPCQYLCGGDFRFGLNGILGMRAGAVRCFTRSLCQEKDS